MITKETVAEKIRDYLPHRLSLANLVDWEVAINVKRLAAA